PLSPRARRIRCREPSRRWSSSKRMPSDSRTATDGGTPCSTMTLHPIGSHQPPQRTNPRKRTTPSAESRVITWQRQRIIFSRTTGKDEFDRHSRKQFAMNDLLDFVLEAHGGLKRWSRVESVTVAASITGEIWQTKSKPDYLKNVTFNAETKRERVTMEFPGQAKRSVFEPNRVEMQRLDGSVIATRDDPESSFRGQEQ